MGRRTGPGLRFLRGRPQPAGAIPHPPSPPPPVSSPAAPAPRWRWAPAALVGFGAASLLYCLMTGSLRLGAHTTHLSPRGVRLIDDGEVATVDEAPPAGWRVLKDTPEEKEMDYDDGKGTRRYVYRRTWGTTSPADGVVPDGPLRDPFQDIHRELDAVFRGLLQPFGSGFAILPGGGGDMLFPQPTPPPSGLGPSGRTDKDFRDFVRADPDPCAPEDRPRRPPRL
jgi:hypothetical protein